MSGTLYQQITQRSSSGEAGSISIQSADYSDGILTTTLRINPNDYLPDDFVDEDLKTLAFNVEFIDRTRGVELDTKFNLHLDLSGDLTDSFEREFSVPVPDNTEVEILFENKISYAFQDPDSGVIDTRMRTETVSGIVTVGNPGKADIVAEVTERGVTFRILRATRDGDAGLIEAEVEAESGLEKSPDGFIRVGAGASVNDIQVRSRLGEVPIVGSNRRTVTFDRLGKESVVVSLIHPSIEGDIVIESVPLSPGDISEPVSQLSVESLSAGQIGNGRAVSTQYQVENATVANGGEEQSGVVQFYFLTDPDLAPDPGQEAQVLAEVPVTVPAGSSVSETVEIRDDLLPVGEYRICGRMG
jgi:hypothetical protein